MSEKDRTIPETFYSNPRVASLLRLILFCTTGALLPFVEAGADPFFAGVAPNSLTPRSALVIGVGNYETLRPLGDNPVNDANKVGDLLSREGFGQIIRSINPRRNELLDHLDELEHTVAASPGVMLVYYSGHGISTSGRAYLAPADAQLRGPEDLEDRMIPLRRIYDAFERAKPRQAILIFDACRSDPFKGQLTSTSWVTGLKGTESPAPFGMYVAYSTVEGRTASNGALSNSPFTTMFLQWAPREQSISEVFTRVREALATPLIQQPSASLDSFVGHFKFLMTRVDFDEEQGQFARVRQNDISSLYENFLNTYRSGYFYNAAAENLTKAKEREAENASGALASPNRVPAAPISPSVKPTPAVPGATNSDVELHATPDFSDRPLRTIAKGTPVVVIGRVADAFKVAIAGGGEGYLPQTAIEAAPSLEDSKIIRVSSTGALSPSTKIGEAGTKAIWQNQTVFVQATIPSGAASDKATVGLKAALDAVAALRKTGVAMDKVVVSPTLHQGPAFTVKLLNLPAGRL